MDLPTPPKDVSLRNIINKLAEFVARNGPEFEQITKAKQQGNPKFSFLYGGEYYPYYQWRVTTEQACLNQRQGITGSGGGGSVGVGNNTGSSSVGVVQELNNTLTNPMLSPNNSTSTSSSILSSVPVQNNNNNNNVRQIPNLMVQSWNNNNNNPPGMNISNNNNNRNINNSQIEGIIQQQNILREQIRQSEHNLSAQHSVLLQQQQTQIDDAVDKAQIDDLEKMAEEAELSIPEFEKVLKPIIDTCTKDGISAGKNWILQHSSDSAKCNFIMQYLLYKALVNGASFTQKLHLIYLINYILHYCVRKRSDELKVGLEYIVIPMFCSAKLMASEEQNAKLTKLLSLWESKPNFLGSCVISKLNVPKSSIAEYKHILSIKYETLIATINKTTETALENYQQQHQAFVQHATQQINMLDSQKQTLEQQAAAIPSLLNTPLLPPLLPPGVDIIPNNNNNNNTNNNSNNSNNNNNNNRMGTNCPPPLMGQNLSMPNVNLPPPPPPSSKQHSFNNNNNNNGSGLNNNGIDHNSYQNPEPPGTGYALPPPNFLIPDLSKPPPGFTNPQQQQQYQQQQLLLQQQQQQQLLQHQQQQDLQNDQLLQQEQMQQQQLLQQQQQQQQQQEEEESEHLEEDVIENIKPTRPYFELPAGLMVPLIRLEDYQYHPLDPEEIRLPQMKHANDRIISAIEAFYSMPSHDRPRDGEGWEKLGLYEYYKVKNGARKTKEEEIAQGTRERSRSPTPIIIELMKPKRKNKRYYKSKSRSKSRSRSRSKSPIENNQRRSNNTRRSNRWSRSPKRNAPSPSRRSISPPPSTKRNNYNNNNNNNSNNNNNNNSNSNNSNSGRGGGSGNNDHTGSGNERERNNDRERDRVTKERESSVSPPPSFFTGNYSKTINDTIEETNKGHQMLMKMGWAGGGTGLGAQSQGIDSPISGGELRDKKDQFKGVGFGANDPYESFRKNKGAAFIHRMRARDHDRRK